MKVSPTIIVLIGFIVLLNINNSIALENNRKVGYLVKERYLKEHHTTNTHDQTKLWVFFNKKTLDDHEQYLNSNHIELNEKAQKRRNTRISTTDKNIYDYNDLPVNKDFIEHIIQECGSINNGGKKIEIKQHKTSKWLNSVSISLKSIESITSKDNDELIRKTIECIASKSFVDRVDVVNTFIKEITSDSFINNEKEEEFLEREQQEEEESLLVTNSHANKKLFKSRGLTENQDNAFDQSFYGLTYGGISQINIPELQKQGYDGYGVTILMIDSGYYKEHEAFASMRIIGEYDFINNQTNTTAPLGNPQNKHGTATLSTIGGYVPGVLVGPAYNASFLLAKTEVVATENQIEEDYWISALEWGEENGADLVSSSLGYTSWYNYSDLNSQNAPITIAADIAASKGMVIVISAGNDDQRGIGAPADGRNVIAVGALTLEGKNTYFSSIGPASDGRVKPDISALGYNNYVAYHVGPNNYTHMSGTSFACPLAAGGIALLMQAHPDWTQQEIYNAVLGTSSIYSTPNIKIGFGILNSDQASLYTQKYAATATCQTVGCSGHGGCCSGKCFCAPNRYGQFCELTKIPCGIECDNRGGKCQFDKMGYSFNCVDVQDSDIDNYNPRDLCNACDSTFDQCGICGGNSTTCLGCDGVAFSEKVIDSCGVCGGDGICKAVVVPEESQSKLQLILGVSIGFVAVVGLIAGSVLLYRKRSFLSISSDGSMPFLKGFTQLENLEDSFSIEEENEVDYE